MNTIKRRLRRAIKLAGNALLGALSVWMIKGLRLIPLERMADYSGWFMRKIGPLLRENKIGRDNLTAAFPEKSADEIDAILRGVWDNLGRMGAEFAHLDRLWNYDRAQPPGHGYLDLPEPDLGRFKQLANDGKPALIFTAHLANWELPAICAASFGIDSAALYRKPNIAAIDRWLHETRAVSMGELIATGLDAPLKMAQALERGAHVGMLVDQYYVRGVDVVFFGRKTKANPLLARLARHFDCPIHGTRFIRLPDHRFRGQLTEELIPVRDATGKVDIAGTTQAIMSVIEGWIREYPEQWLWLHRRWRPEDQA